MGPRCLISFALLACTTYAADVRAQDAPTKPAAPAAKPPGGAPVDLGALPPGRVHLVMFAGREMRFVAGAAVSVSGGATRATDRRGSVFVDTPPGVHTIRVHVPTGALPAAPDAVPIELEFPDVDVVSGGTTRLIITLGADGQLLDTDLFVPDGLVPEVARPAPPGGEAAAPPGTSGHAVVSGRVLSSAGEPIAGAEIYVLGSRAEGQTGPDGGFSLGLPEGVYSLSIVHPDFTGQTLEGVVASAGEINEFAITLAPAPKDMEDYLVRGRRARGSVATVIEERRASASVTDAVGAEDISRSPDSTASAATRRIVGATIVGGQYLFVRGLGGRYTSVRLNGVPLPSTDPDLPGFQLDLFPASMLSALNVAKTFTPDIPGDFAGGSMNVVTRDYPERFQITTSIGLSSNTETLGRDMRTYPGGDLDWLGLDDGTRAMPGAVPDVRLTSRGNSELEREDVVRIGRAFSPVFETTHRAGLPNLSLGFSLGNSQQAFGKRLDYLFTLGYRYQLKRYDELIERWDQAEGVSERLERETGKEEASVGLLGALSYELARGHDLSVVSMLTQNGEDTASLTRGVSESEAAFIERTQLRYVGRRLFFNQLLGNHDLDALQLDWQLNASTVARDQPDTRNIFYEEVNGRLEFGDAASNGERLFAELSMLDLGGGFDVTVPIAASKARAGYLGRMGDRDVGARRFVPVFRGRSVDRSLPPNELLNPGNLSDDLYYEERTLDDDGFAAEEDLHAGYGLVDISALPWLRLSGGARVESFRQAIEIASPFASGRVPAEALSEERTEADVLPSAALVLELSEQMSVRAAYGGTVARPLVRELAPFQNFDYVRNRTVAGNPELKRTYIHNFDLRWELFPSAGEVLAVSGFYKIFRDPIESIIVDAAGNLTYDNIDRATNYGVEFEVRLDLDRVAATLDGFLVSANFAWIHSRVDLSDEEREKATSPSRPMAGQSPYVANLLLGYSDDGTGLSLNLFYNVFGPRILDVGRDPWPDVYERPFHSVDATASYKLGRDFKLRVSGTNLLRQPVEVKQGDARYALRHEGIGFGVSLGYAN